VTTTETPAALLRQAASLMRERADQAPPGPWAALDGGVASLADEGFWPVDTTGINEDGIDRATRVHIASWHPLVALAVADLLDKIAWMGELDADMLSRVGCDEAIAIARAYLGETDDH
jgi:hypothetical protein